MLDIATAYNRYKFIGHEFLTWLLYLIETDGHRLGLSEPQSIALATLAGMPPEYGIYTSIFPVSRSKAGAFLLRERNIKAMSMIGGIRDWPYEVDASPVDVV